MKRDRSNPALLEGYGSYGNSTDATFRVNIFSLVDRGMSTALPRSVGEASWVSNGMKMGG